jgi:hypothetical protein
VVAALVAGCAAHPAIRSRSQVSPRLESLRQVEGRPPVALLVREGDPKAALGLAVLTAGVDPAHGAEVAVALAAVVDARLGAAGVRDYRVVPGGEGFRVRALLPGDRTETSAERAQEITAALRAALLTPLAAEGPEMGEVERKLAALARRPLPDPVLRVAVECTGEPFGAGHPSSEPPITFKTVEAWRVASHGLGRVALAAVGTSDEVEAIATAAVGMPRWPSAAPVAASIPPPADDIQVYDATPDVPAGAARISIVVQTADSARAALVADALGDPRGSLEAHLSTLEPLARVRSVTATAHVGWGCVEITLDLPSPDGIADPPVNVAAATDLAREEALADLAGGVSSGSVAREVANRAGDPRDAAERLAYWTVVAAAPAPSSQGPFASFTTVGLSAMGSGPSSLAELGSALRAELDRAASSRREPAGDLRVRVERGQSELWVLLASPCGTEPETEADAGSGALAAMALADRARRGAEGSGAVAEEWVTTDGLGLIVHAPATAVESGADLAHRVAELAARSFGAPLSESQDLAAVRTILLAHPDGGVMQRSFSILADAIAPGHPSWLLPLGTTESLERSSDEAVRARLNALRAGPLRIAVLANHDRLQAEVVLQTVGGWLPRRTGRPPACPGSATPTPPRPGTYAVETPGASSVDAWLAFALPPGEPVARGAATLIAGALTARGGLLEHALGVGLARSWGAKVLGSARAPALVVRISSAQGSLDAAVAEMRVLFDRLRQEGLTRSDRALALAEIADARLELTLDPKARLVALWRGEESAADANSTPSVEEVRAFAARTLRDEALIIVASRPPRSATPKAP